MRAEMDRTAPMVIRNPDANICNIKESNRIISYIVATPSRSPIVQNVTPGTPNSRMGLL